MNFPIYTLRMHVIILARFIRQIVLIKMWGLYLKTGASLVNTFELNTLIYYLNLKILFTKIK